MAVKVYAPEQKPVKEHIGIYGVSGVGKTTFALSVPEDPFGKIGYVAFDDNSETLRVCPPSTLPRVTIIKPQGDNPLVNLDQVAATRWSKEIPGLGTLVLDTVTTIALRALLYVANQGFFSGSGGDKHVVIGVPGKGMSMAIPVPGDYGAMQNIIRGFFDTLFMNNDDVHILALFHQKFGQDKQKDFVGGPATVGSASIEETPTNFDTVIRLERKMTSVKDAKGVVSKTSRVVARTDQHGYWIAKLREGGGKGNPIPEVELDFTGANFWPRYMEVVGGSTSMALGKGF